MATSPVQHLTVYKDLMATCQHMWQTMFIDLRRINSNQCHWRAYFITLNLAIEHLLKSGLVQAPKIHSLEHLVPLFEKDTKYLISKDLKEKIAYINQFGYPVDGSFRYPERGVKTLRFDLALVSDWDELAHAAERSIRLRLNPIT